jgi:hypothetical protein
MAFKWKTRGLQARFMLIASAGILALAACTLIVVGWFEYSGLENKLRIFGENELRSLNSLVESAMDQRLSDVAAQRTDILRIPFHALVAVSMRTTLPLTTIVCSAASASASCCCQSSRISN